MLPERRGSPGDASGPDHDMSAGALLASCSAAACLLAASATAAPSAAKSACTLLTHAQISTLIVASHYTVVMSSSDHCAWSTPGPEITANELQLTTKPVNASDTLVGQSASTYASKGDCGSGTIKHFETAGVIGDYCIATPNPFSSALISMQEGGLQASISIVYGATGARVNASALVADGKEVLKEIHA